MAILLAAGTLQCFSSQAPAKTAPGGGRLHGTFVQLLNAHGNWTAEKWRELFQYFQQLGLSQVIVQWTVLDDTSFYPSSTFKAVAGVPPLETILTLADQAGIKVLVGLAHDAGYWTRISQAPDQVERYLGKLRTRSEAASSQLTPVVQKHPSFQGWYLPEEIDDVNWVKPERRQILFRHLAQLTSHLKKQTPAARVAISGFSNAHMDPVALERFWSGLLEASAVDVVLFQDGIGVGKLQLEHLPVYLAAVRNAADDRKRTLQVVVETFRQTAGPPISAGAFQAAPAALERIQQQLDLAAQFSTAGPIAFSVPEYMTPLGGARAGELFQEFLKKK